MTLTVKQRFFLAIRVLAFPLSAISGDPDIISDFVVPMGQKRKHAWGLAGHGFGNKSEWPNFILGFFSSSHFGA
ncbi:germin-like protein 9-3 [Gossypium australe]|uniref:Germin-like protein 9-3 n=1 Tax=Gossypium australe TaxID=47621 RepID=A0A5B6VEN1_9ROSI|nr:germin-like protein 9-3 [Gossypium australe]